MGMGGESLKNHSTPWYALLVCSLFLMTLPLSAQTEIAIEDDEPAPTKATTTAPAQAAPAQSAPAKTTSSQEQEEEGAIEVEEETEEKVEEKKAVPEEVAEEETSSTEEEEGSANVGAMRPLYEAGIKAYRQKNYWRAITLLSKASETKDKATPKYYYAEAHAMMGVIFQFYLKNPTKACRQYQLALKIDPKTRTALKYRGKVCR
jgi:tetratricopeptide (TPR) repeat protein